MSRTNNENNSYQLRNLSSSLSRTLPVYTYGSLHGHNGFSDVETSAETERDKINIIIILHIHVSYELDNSLRLVNLFNYCAHVCDNILGISVGFVSSSGKRVIKASWV